MKIRVLHLGLIKTNCYLLESDRAAVVIDPGYFSAQAETFLKEAEGKERLILITHAHFDHIGGAEALREATGVKIGIGEGDADDLADPVKNLSQKFHAHIAPFAADEQYRDGETVTVGDLSFRVLAMPGHTVGGVAYQIGGCVFSGDTLFEGAVGRTDFPGGDFKTLKKSVKRLMTLDPDTVVYPGHGDPTTIGREKETNLFAW
ncbi:MAG: MBL fold metallo-hydrolase [Clostridia bacterium]|nr:MBL fold metallo-hydrolase [Clostridia bacterium]